MELIWIESERCWGEVIERHAAFCMVSFYKDGIFHEEVIEAEDLIDLRQMGIDYESDDGDVI